MSKLDPSGYVTAFLGQSKHLAATAMSTLLDNANKYNTHHMESVASLLIALYLACAVSDPDKGAWVLQQAHDLRFWQLSVALVV